MMIDTKKIERTRLIRGWNKSKVAQLTGLHTSTVTRVEQGRNLKPSTVKAIADVLGLDMAELIIDEGRKRSA